jgi:hypothetical protein
VLSVGLEKRPRRTYREKAEEGRAEGVRQIEFRALVFVMFAVLVCGFAVSCGGS